MNHNQQQLEGYSMGPATTLGRTSDAIAGMSTSSPSARFSTLLARKEINNEPDNLNMTALNWYIFRLGKEPNILGGRQQDESSVVCEGSFLYKYLMGYGFLVLFCLALVGNCLNLLIFNSEEIRYYIAIRMLFTKLLMNTMTLFFLLPQAFRIIYPFESDFLVLSLTWKIWPYQAYFTNAFGFCAMWLTVLMTVECYLYIFFPGRSKALCTKRNLYRMYALVGITGFLLPLIYPLNRIATPVWQSGRLNVVSKSRSEIVLERVYHIVNLLLAILVPLALLVFMTCSIVWRLGIRPRSCGRHSSNSLSHFGCATQQHFSAEKRGVTRITLMTTILQLLTELPSVPLFMAATLIGPQIMEKMCAWQTVSHFLALCNMSLSFFVYVTFSNRFRKKILRRVKRLLRRIGAHFSSGTPQLFAENSSEKLHNFVVSRTTSIVGGDGANGDMPPNYGVNQGPNANGTKHGLSVTTVLLTTNDCGDQKIIRADSGRAASACASGGASDDERASYCRSYTLTGLDDVVKIDVNIRVDSNNNNTTNNNKCNNKKEKNNRNNVAEKKSQRKSGDEDGVSGSDTSRTLETMLADEDEEYYEEDRGRQDRAYYSICAVERLLGDKNAGDSDRAELPELTETTVDESMRLIERPEDVENALAQFDSYL